MNCNNEFRHVCIKDLEDYVKRDKYFSDYTDEEIRVIQENLKMYTIDDIIIKGTYDTICKLWKNAKLKVGYVYVITDFRSIYEDKDGVTCGLDSNLPSKEFQLILYPNGSDSFDSRVSLYNMYDLNCNKWVVEYDITPVTLSDGTVNRGTITFLKDNNNNYAYYDFKNIRYKLDDTYYYTFGETDLSNTKTSNVHLEKGATGNIFMKKAVNVTLSANCHDNIFMSTCQNSIFDSGTYSNTFNQEVSNCHGVVHDKTIDEYTNAQGIKTFMTLLFDQIICYLDADTQTYQYEKL